MKQLESIAVEVLRGVGNPLREWRFPGKYAFHICRRLTYAEQLRVGEAVDLRQSPESLQRLEAALDYLPTEAYGVVFMEMGIKVENFQAKSRRRFVIY